jgi:hypothetical protein
LKKPGSPGFFFFQNLFDFGGTVMPRTRNGHVLKFEDGYYFIEDAPFKAPYLEDADIYTKYFDLLEAQARAKRNTQMDAEMVRISFRIAEAAEI